MTELTGIVTNYIFIGSGWYFQESEKREPNVLYVAVTRSKYYSITLLLIFVEPPTAFFISKSLPLGLQWAKSLVLILPWEGSVSIVAPMISNNQPNFNIPLNISSFNRNDVYTIPMIFMAFLQVVSKNTEVYLEFAKTPKLSPHTKHICLLYHFSEARYLFIRDGYITNFFWIPYFIPVY